jgi:hypothetical protein
MQRNIADVARSLHRLGRDRELKASAITRQGCNCGAPLMSKAQRAIEAIAANPQKSNRAIAEDAGVSFETVRRARQATDTDVSVKDEARVGIDGRQRRMPIRPYSGKLFQRPPTEAA